MKIQELYDKDIERRINPAVVVSERDQYSVNQEIDEYVFTNDITENIYKFLKAIVKKNDPNKKGGKTGVWISGYYGSGKSHFIKYLFYCLDKEYRERAFSNFKESVNELDLLNDSGITTSNVSKLYSSLNSLDIDEIIFNIDAVADNNDVKDRITRVLLNQLNEFRGYNNTNIALALYLEKPLDNKGHFEAFKQRIKQKYSEDWDGAQIRFIRMYLSEVINIAKEFDPDLDVESLRLSILNKEQDYTIEFLINEFKDFLKGKPDNYRLLFLMDEVSQYIGSNTSLLLNLQTIIEEIGSQIGTKVWVVCTAQQDLSNMISNTDSKAEDFGKIMGRFETKISLDSQDAAFITKKRILDKNSNGIGQLTDFYKEHKGDIENQFVFDHDLYENYKTQDDFTLTYPFIPYQFRLISDVFESFSNSGYVGEGVKNTERAILGITHFTAKLCKNKEIGYFVPFNLFFNQQFETNLSHRARGIIDRAYKIEEVKNNVFAQNVVNVLFMISNLGDSQTVNFPANIENISLLLMESADTLKMEMQTKTQKTLDVLVSKNIIQVSEGKYRFMKEDEIEVAHRIKKTIITNEDRLKYIFDDIIQKVVKPLSQLGQVNYGNKSFRIAISIDDKEYGSRGDFNLKFSIYDNTNLDQLAHLTSANNLVIGINEWFNGDNVLKSSVEDYVQTQKYISTHSSAATGTRNETLNNFRDKNKLLLNEIKIRFEKLFLQTSIISNQQLIAADELKGASPAARYDNMVEKHMAQTYRKHKLSNNYAQSNADFIVNAKSKQKTTIKDLDNAEQEMETKLNLEGSNPLVGDVVKQFEKAPYGWKDIATLDILLSIAKKGLRRFEWRNEEINFTIFADKALNARERDAITIHHEILHSQEEINDLIDAVNNEIFVETIIPSKTTDFKEAITIFKEKINPLLKKINNEKEDYESYPFSIHLKKYYRILSEIYNTPNNEKLANRVISQKGELKILRDICKNIEEFIEYNITDYDKIKQFISDNRTNFSSLDEMNDDSSKNLMAYLKDETMPWENFPQMKKLYKELSHAINTILGDLSIEVIGIYSEIFKEIDVLKEELKIEGPNLTTDSDYYLQNIKREKQIARLVIFKLKATDFRADNFKLLQNYKDKQEAKKAGKDYTQSYDVSLAAEMPPTTISTPDQLDEYINKLRSQLMIKLKKNIKLYLK